MDDVRVKFRPDGVQGVLAGFQQIGSAAKLAAAAAAVGMVALVSRTMEAIDAQAKLARELRTSTTGLETMKRAASLAGVDVEKMVKATRNLEVQTGRAIQGEKAYADAFARLRINLEEFTKLDADQRIMAINKALRDNVPAAERAAVAADLYGAKLGRAISRIGEGDLSDAREEVEALGLAVSDVDSRTIERANDSFSVMGEVLRGAANRITVELGPALESIATAIRTAAVESRGFENEIRFAFDVAIRMAGLLGDAWHGLQMVFKGVALLVAEAIQVPLAAAEVLPTAVEAAIDGVLKNVNLGIRALNMLPGINLPEVTFEGHRTAAQFFRNLTDSARGAADSLRADLERIAAEPLPSARLDEWLEKVKATSREVSLAASNADREGEAGGGTSSGGGAGGGAADKAMAKRLEKLRESLRSETEAEQVNHAKRLEDLMLFHNNGMIQTAEYNKLLEAEELRHREVMAKIEEAKNADLVKAQERSALALENLRLSLLSEEEAEFESHERKLAQLAEAIAREQVMGEEAARIREEMEKRHMKNLEEIRKKGLTAVQRFNEMSWSQQAKTVFDELSSITSGVANHSRALFNLNKVAGIANAIVNAHVGITRTLSAYPYPFNIGLAAAHAAAAFAQVNAIRSQSFGGGSAAPSLAGSTAATPVSAVEGGAPAALGSGGSGSGGNRNLNIQLHGTIFGRDQIEQLVNGINEFMGDGGSLKVKVQS